MEHNKKGLSMIVSTLIIILLVLVAVGIIWVVARNVIQGGSEQIEISAKCLEVSISATGVNCVQGETSDNCTVTLTRAAGGEAIGGVKLAFVNAAGTANYVSTYSGDIGALETVTTDYIETVAVNETSKVEVTPFFLDSSNNEQLCSLSTEYTY